MSNILIREAVPEDLPTLLSFEEQLIIAERPFDVTMRDDKRFHYYDIGKMITDPEAAVVVAELDGKLVASGHGIIREAKAFNRFETYAFLGFMFTVPDQRGKGLNQLIINELVGWAKRMGQNEVRLQVYDENEPAIAAYEKVGFQKILTEMRLTLPISLFEKLTSRIYERLSRKGVALWVAAMAYLQSAGLKQLANTE